MLRQDSIMIGATFQPWKDDIALEIDPRKHNFQEYVDFGEDDGGSLELASAMGGAEGDEDVDKYQQAYNAVGGNVDKMVSWLKKNKHVDMTAKDELKNSIRDWLKNHRKAARDESVDVETLLDFIKKDDVLSQEFQNKYAELRSDGQSHSVIELYFEEMLNELVGDVAPETDQATVANVAKQLVNSYRDASNDDFIEGVDEVPEKNRGRYITESELRDLADKYREVSKIGLVDTTEPSLREVIRY